MIQQLPCIIHIQKYSIHDGDGIRSTVFFKGCPLSCLWCHNPESKHYDPELFTYYNRCTGCGVCIMACPQHAIAVTDGKMTTNRSLCTTCGACIELCPNNAREVIGKQFTVNELIKELEKDRQFYEDSGGGITLSGGEVMAQKQMDYIEELCQKLYKKGYHINIDTCGLAPYENFQRLLPFINTFLYDIKLMNETDHRKFTGAGNTLILENLSRLSKDGANINLRIPVISGVNDYPDFFLELISYLKNTVTLSKINLLPYHATGKTKYDNLDLDYNEQLLQVPSHQRMQDIAALFQSNGFQTVKIGG